jgi:hypothetical protein
LLIAVARALQKEVVFRKDTMTASNQANHIHQESTYKLLVDSEDKEHGFIEDIVYLLLVVATTVTIWQLSHQPVTLANIGTGRASVSEVLEG